MGGAPSVHVVIEVDGFEEVRFEANENTRIKNLIHHAENITGVHIEGLSIPALAREGFQFGRNERLWDLPQHQDVRRVGWCMEHGHKARFCTVFPAYHHQGDSWGGWAHAQAVVHVGQEEVLCEVNARTTIEDLIVFCENATGMEIQGLTSAHMLREGCEWRRGDQVLNLKGPFQNRIDLIALFPDWGYDRLMDHHRERFVGYW